MFSPGAICIAHQLLTSAPRARSGAGGDAPRGGCAPAHVVASSREQPGRSRECRPLPRLLQKAPGKWIWLGGAAPRTETRAAKDTLNSFISSPPTPIPIPTENSRFTFARPARGAQSLRSSRRVKSLCPSRREPAVRLGFPEPLGQPPRSCPCLAAAPNHPRPGGVQTDQVQPPNWKSS